MIKEPLPPRHGHTNSSISEKSVFQSKKRKFELDERSETKLTIDVNNVEKNGQTTLMIKNIPNKYTKELMLTQIMKNHAQSFNFFYLPIDFKVVYQSIAIC